MLMLLVLLLVVVTFQVLAAAGNMAAVRPGALLVIWALLALCVGLFGQWGVFPWLASAVLCGVLVRRALERGAGVWRAALWGLVPVLVASAVPFLTGAPDEIWSDFQHQVENLVLVPEGQTPEPGPEERALRDRHRELALTAGRWMLRLFPAEVLAINLFQVLGVVLSAGWLARRRDQTVALPPVTQWRVPFAMVWPLAVSLLLLTFRSLPLTVVGLNAALVILAFLSAQGASVFLHLMGRNIPLRWRALVLLLCALTALPLLLVFCAMLGAADLWVDFRKLRTSSGIAAKGGEDRWK
jgi:hypothetical protein